MTNSRQKGKRGELEAVKLLREHGFTARRGVQYSGGPGSPDIVVEELPGIHFEVKFGYATPDWIAWMNQADREAAERVSVVLYKPARKPWRAAIQSLVQLNEDTYALYLVGRPMFPGLLTALATSDRVEIDNKSGIVVIAASALLEALKQSQPA